MKMWSDQERDYDIMGWKDQCNSISCGSRDHVQLIRRAVHSDEIGIALVGCLKVRILSILHYYLLNNNFWEYSNANFLHLISAKLLSLSR